MATVDVLDWNKKKVGSVDLAPEVFEKEVRTDLLHSIVKWQLACRRQGTHKVKTRSEVRGGGKKPFKQKGTGNARQGSTRSPLREGGGITFGPRPRNYSYVVPKKVKKSALKSALSYLTKEGRLFVVSDMNSETGKTKELAKRLNLFGTDKAVLIDVNENDSFKRAIRNLPKYRYYSVKGLNVYDLLKYDTLIVTQEVLEPIVKRCEVGK